MIAAVVGVMEKASAMLRECRPETIITKGHQDYVSDVDLRLDDFLQKSLSALTPGIPVLSEERWVDVAAPIDDWWIVDPLDGTANFLAGIPFVGISIALVDRDGLKAAAVASPFQNMLWTAKRGQGANVNGEVLKIETPPPSLIAVSTGYCDSVQDGGAAGAWRALRRAGKFRNLGAQSLHLCGVAQGWFGAAISLEAKLWDEAGAGLILREAGGVWRSNADWGDWKDPAGMMTGCQKSVASHPDLAPLLANVLPKSPFDAGHRRTQ